MNNFYKNTAGNFANIFADSGSAINIKRNSIDFIVAADPTDFYDNSFLRIRETYSSDAPLSRVQIAGNEVVFQNRTRVETIVYNMNRNIFIITKPYDSNIEVNSLNRQISDKVFWTFNKNESNKYFIKE
jgi:hypothetical protein